MEAAYFASPAEFRRWLEAHHDTAEVLLVGFYKKHTGTASSTYQEALDEALCFGWIDGVRKSVDEQRYTIRFTPRKPGSMWSLVNIRRADELVRLGRMQPAGLKAYAARDEQRAEQYSYERENRPLDAQYEAQFRANQTAWDFFQTQAPSYRKAANWWVMSAKQEKTRLKRLTQLIDDSANGRRVASLTPPGKRT